MKSKLKKIGGGHIGTTLNEVLEKEQKLLVASETVLFLLALQYTLLTNKAGVKNCKICLNIF